MIHKFSKPMLVAFAALSTITPAQAEEANNWYFSGALGLTITQDADYEASPLTGDFELDNALNISVALGRQITDHILGELELSHRKADMDSLTVDGVGSAEVGGDLTTTALMLNGYVDLMPEKSFTPYLSAGLGIARHDSEVSGGGITVSGDDTVFAYQLGAGVNYDMASRTELFGGYRYFGTSDADFDTLEAEYGAHELRVGVRYKF